MASGDRFWVLLVVALLGLKALAIGDFRHVFDLERDDFQYCKMLILGVYSH